MRTSSGHLNPALHRLAALIHWLRSMGDQYATEAKEIRYADHVNGLVYYLRVGQTLDVFYDKNLIICVA